MKHEIFRKGLLLALLAIALTACNHHFCIHGTSSIPELEGRRLNLRIFDTDSLRIIAETTVNNGSFCFEGTCDTTFMAFLFVDDESLMPLVIDGNPLTMKLSDEERIVTGNAYNDSLFKFIATKSSLDAALEDLPRRESQMLLNGMTPEQAQEQLEIEAAVLQSQEDEIVMSFILDNMDNVMGSGVFMVVTSNFPYPILNPQIEELVTFASPKFLCHPYVSAYLRMARENMEQFSQP